MRARKEFLLYMSRKTSATLEISLVKPDGLIHYWKNQGAKDYPVLAVVALSQLATPPGSGVLENDFSRFANLLTRHRSKLDPATVEMILFCKLNISLIQASISVIKADELDSHIPTQLRDPTVQAQLREMYHVPDDSEEDVENEIICDGSGEVDSDSNYDD